ncbi:MAG: type II toxin-antitoxin system prevent-host-death family antitoxin [Hyphomicrobiales bacterium]|nr:type II toxin-antitoxin system prevent-host-death family antitoxin [Hyphomicrobiales bacterium]MDE2017404.1 type II toxin-antitoxin system prevent-host-death family antitoxin [Hyphomicrobiales bacterium]
MAVKEFGAFEAKNRLGHLLDLVEAGEEVVITRRGRAVVRMVPLGAPFDRQRGNEAARRIRERRKGVTLGGLAIKELVGEGRR